MISNETVTLEKVLSEFKKISNQYEEDKIKFNKTVEPPAKEILCIRPLVAVYDSKPYFIFSSCNPSSFKSE